MVLHITRRHSKLFETAATRLAEAQSVDALKRSLRTTRSLWIRVDRLIERGQLPLSGGDAETLRRQASFVVDTLDGQAVLSDGQIEQMIEINRQAMERLAAQVVPVD